MLRFESSPFRPGDVHGIQTPSPGMASSTRLRTVSASRSKSARNVPRSFRACSRSSGDDSFLSAARLKGFSSSNMRPTRYDCQASGSRVPESRAKPSQRCPKTSTMDPGSGRSRASISISPRKSRATTESRTPRKSARPPRFEKKSFHMLAFHDRRDVSHRKAVRRSPGSLGFSARLRGGYVPLRGRISLLRLSGVLGRGVRVRLRA